MKRIFINFVYDESMKWIKICVYVLGVIYFLILNHFTQINMASINKLMSKIGLNENIVNYNHWYITIAYFLFLTWGFLDSYTYLKNKHRRLLNILVYFISLTLVILAALKYYNSADFLCLLGGAAAFSGVIKLFYRKNILIEKGVANRRE